MLEQLMDRDLEELKSVYKNEADAVHTEEERVRILRFYNDLCGLQRKLKQYSNKGRWGDTDK